MKVITNAIAKEVIKIGTILNSKPAMFPTIIDSQFFKVKPPKLSLPSSGTSPSVR